MNAVVYARISRDRVGAGLGVARQREDCQKLIVDRGWTLVGVYEDNDISAYSGKVRPGYQRMLADLDSGQINAVIAWHTDRLHRSPRELEEWIDTDLRTQRRHHGHRPRRRTRPGDRRRADGRQDVRRRRAA